MQKTTYYNIHSLNEAEIINNKDGGENMKTKKLFVLMVLAMFVVSLVPLAVAEEINDATDLELEEEFIAETEAEDAAVEAMEAGELPADPQKCWERIKVKHPRVSERRAKHLCRAKHVKRMVRKEVKKVVRKDIRKTQLTTSAKSISQGLRKHKPMPLIKRRVIAKDRLKKMRGNYLKAKERYVEVKGHYLKAKRKFLIGKEKFKKCKGDDSVECKEVRKEGKEFLLHAADVVLNTLERIKTKIESSEDLTEDEAAEMLSDIESSMSEVKVAKETIENMDENSTEEEIKEAAKTIREAWKKVRPILKRHVGWLAGSKIRHMLAKFDKLDSRLRNVQEKLEAKGHDTTDLNNLLDDFESKLADAKDNYEKAVEKYKEAKTAKEIDSLVKEAHEYMKKARTYLKECGKLLREIIKEIKGKDIVTLTDEEVSEEVEETSEVDDDETSTDTEEEETEEAIIEERISKFKPNYRPGKDLGYFIWQGPKNVWTICASGDGKGHKLKGKITADDGFCRTKPFLYEKGQDKYRVGNDEIRFRAWVGPHHDCLRFATASEEVSFDLYMDGRSANLVYFGPDKDKVGSPADLKGDAFPGCTADVSVESGYELEEDEYEEEITEEEIAVEEVVSDALDEAIVAEVLNEE